MKGPNFANEIDFAILLNKAASGAQYLGQPGKHDVDGEILRAGLQQSNLAIGQIGPIELVSQKFGGGFLAQPQGISYGG